MNMKRLSLLLLIASLGISGAINVLSARASSSPALVLQDGTITAPHGQASMPARHAMEKQMEKFLSEQKIFGIQTLQMVPRVDLNTSNSYDVFNATGFPIDNSTIATVNPIIRDPKKVEGMTNGKWRKLTLVGRVQTKDMSFFTFKDADFSTTALQFKTIGTVFNSFPKDQVTVPLESVLVGMKCMEGNVPRIMIGEILQMQPSTGLFSFSIAGSGAGCSGAPLFSYDGYVIGVCQSGFESGVVAYALDIGEFFHAFNIFKNQQ